MKHAKALKPHDYLGKQRAVGDVYKIRRTDIALYEKLGRIEIVPDPNENPAPIYYEQPNSATDRTPYEKPEKWYRTTAMEPEPEPVRVKRPYRRKVVQKVDGE